MLDGRQPFLLSLMTTASTIYLQCPSQTSKIPPSLQPSNKSLHYWSRKDTVPSSTSPTTNQPHPSRISSGPKASNGNLLHQISPGQCGRMSHSNIQKPLHQQPGFYRRQLTHPIVGHACRPGMYHPQSCKNIKKRSHQVSVPLHTWGAI